MLGTAENRVTKQTVLRRKMTLKDGREATRYDHSPHQLLRFTSDANFLIDLHYAHTHRSIASCLKLGIYHKRLRYPRKFCNQVWAIPKSNLSLRLGA